MIRRFFADKFASGVIWNLFSLVVLASAGILMNFMIVRGRGEAALGIFTQVFAIYIIFSQISAGGIHFSVLKHISYNQQNLDLCADITASAMILVGMLGILTCALTLALAPVIGNLLESDQITIGIEWIAPGLIFFAFNKVLVNVLNGLALMQSYAIFKALRFVYAPIFLAIIMTMDSSDGTLLLALTLAEVVLFINLIIFVYWRVLPVKKINNIFAHFKEHISFGMRGILSGLFTEINSRVDVLVLGYYANDSIVGGYSFAMVLCEGLSQLPLALRWSIDPLLGKYFSENSPAKIIELVARTRKLMGMAMLVIGMIAIGGYPLLIYLVKPDILYSWAIFAIIMIGVMLNAPFRPFTGILIQGGYPGMQSLFIFGLITSNVIFTLLLIPLFEIYGGALANLLFYLFEVILLLLLTRYTLKISLWRNDHAV